MGALVAVVVLGGLAAMFASWYWSDTSTIRRALRGAQHVSISNAPESAVVRLDGRVTEGETLVAPLTGRRCVYYLAIVEERVANGKSNNWRECVREASGVPFAIDDGTGRAIVDPTAARIDVDLDSTARSGTFEDLTTVEEAFLKRHGLGGSNRMLNKTLRYREGVFEVGEPIAIICQPVREPDPDAVSRTTGYRNGPPTRLRVGGSAKHPILLSDSRNITQAVAEPHK